MRPLTTVRREALLDALEKSAHWWQWIGHADEYREIHDIIDNTPTTDEPKKEGKGK